jgi:hypothetical protein
MQFVLSHHAQFHALSKDIGLPHSINPTIDPLKSEVEREVGRIVEE